jgi:probable F420-dependent oxidoreductase
MTGPTSAPNGTPANSSGTMRLALGKFGAWFNPVYEDAVRVRFVAEAEALGYTTAWLGVGRRSMADLKLIEQALDATTTTVVATAIVNVWTNDATSVGVSYQRIAAKHPNRLLLGVGIGHPESIAVYRSSMDTLASYLDILDDCDVPRERRVLASLGPRALRLAAARTAGTHPYLVVPGFTQHALEILGPAALLTPEHKVVVTADQDKARAIGRAFVEKPYLTLSNYVNNLLRHGFTSEDVHGEGSDRLIDALVLHGDTEQISTGLSAHLEAGANHVSVQVLVAPGEDPMPGYRTLARVLVWGRATQRCAETIRVCGSALVK